MSGVRRPRRSRGGFTIVEALVSVAILSVGIVATLTTLGAMARAQTRTLESDEMQRLALRKYDEIVALDRLPSGQSQDDFSDVGQKRFVWRADRTSTGAGNLDAVRVQVAGQGEGFGNAVQIQGLVCRPKGTTQ